MASLKAEKPVGTQLFGQAKKETAAPKTGTASASQKAPASKSAPKKASPKPADSKKKATKGGKSAAKP